MKSFRTDLRPQLWWIADLISASFHKQLFGLTSAVTLLRHTLSFPASTADWQWDKLPPQRKHTHTNSICWLSDFWFHVGSGQLPMSKSMTPQNNKNSSNYSSSLTNVCLPWLSCPCLCVSWVYPSGLFPTACSQSSKPPLLSFSHVSQDKMVSTVAILRASKKNNNTMKYGKGQQGEGISGVPWHSFTSMRSVPWAVGTLGLKIDPWYTNTESFYLWTKDKVTSSSHFVWMRTQVRKQAIARLG